MNFERLGGFETPTGYVALHLIDGRIEVENDDRKHGYSTFWINREEIHGLILALQKAERRLRSN